MAEEKVKKIAIASVGCKTNQYEALWLASNLKRRGADIYKFDETADVYVVFTCAVTHKAEVDSRKLIHNARRRNRKALVVATGCGVQLSPHAYLGEDAADLAVGMNEREKLEAIIKGERAEKNLLVDESEQIRFNPFGIEDLNVITHARAWLKIQEGCASNCSYCIVPHLRGEPRSIPVALVLNEAEKFGERFKEIVLVGTNIGLYGIDLTPRTSLIELVGEIVKLAEKMDFRVRLSSIEPMEFDKKLVDFAQTNFLRPHFHIPLQGFSDRLLKQMSRPYTILEFANLIGQVKSKLPNASIGTDIICGFPTESEQDFTAGAIFIDSLPLSYLHIFSYSSRPNTPAVNLGPPIPNRILKERVTELKKIDRTKRESFAKSQIKNTLEVVIMKSGPGESEGLSENYLTAKVSGSFKPASLVKVLVKKVVGSYILCEEARQL